MNINLTCFNIRYQDPSDGENNWPHRKHLLSSIVEKNKSTIIATQEGRKKQLYEVQEELGSNFQIIDEHRDWISERMYPSLYIDKSAYSVLGSGDFWLSKTPHVAGSSDFKSTFPRLCTWSKLKLKKGPQSFYIFNTHLDHVLEDTRNHQTNILLQEINKILPPKGPALLCGDFNSSPQSLVYQNATNQWNDPWPLFHTQEIATSHKFNGNSQDNDRIDWILYSDQLQAKNIYADTRTFQGRYPSDHFPIHAQFIFKHG